MAILIKAIDTFGFIGALPAGTLVEISDRVKVFTLYFSAVFSFILTALLAIDIITSGGTEGVARFTIMVEAINALATILAFPAVALIWV